jgi:hypothetical protein
MKSACLFLLGFLVCAIIFKMPVVSRNRLIAINDSIPDLNRGGCGFFAYKLFQRLDKKKYSLVVIDHGRHIMIWDWDKNLYIDSKGFHTKVDVQLHDGSEIEQISEDSLRRLLFVDKFWNKTFCKEDTTIINNFIDNL